MALPFNTNPRILAENIKRLETEIHDLDIEIPSHSAGDAGKYLGVDASGDLAFSNVPNELPPTTEATAGQILALDSEKAPAWVNNYNLDYSETEQVTGQKWINGDDLYCKVISGYFETISQTSNIDVYDLTNENIVNAICVCRTSSGDAYYNRFSTYVINDKLSIQNVTTGFTLGSYSVIIYYTKSTPSALTSTTPETREMDPEEVTETKTTKRKSSK